MPIMNVLLRILQYQGSGNHHYNNTDFNAKEREKMHITNTISVLIFKNMYIHTYICIITIYSKIF